MKRMAILLLAVICLFESVFVLGSSAASNALADLVVTNVRLSDGSVYYSVKNTGNAGTGKGVSFYVTLNVDGQQASKDIVQDYVSPGQELERVFSYQFPSDGKHLVSVYVDSFKNVNESNEENNSYEVTLGSDTKIPEQDNGQGDIKEEPVEPGEVQEEQQLPDFVISELTVDNDTGIVRYTVKNTGKGAAEAGSFTTHGG